MEKTSDTAENRNIETIDCSDLDEFWNIISPIGERFGQPNSSFIFRGQSDSTWKLVPQVYRKDVIDKYKKGMMSTLRDYPGQTFFEWVLLNGFIKYCDSKGMAVPDDSMEFREYFSQNKITNTFGIDSKSWPENRVLPLMALAQHHGLPTRLLDWSSNSYVGCYFAAAAAIRGPLLDHNKIALFAIDLKKIMHARDIKHIKVPGSTSVNLSSQYGSFVLVGQN